MTAAPCPDYYGDDEMREHSVPSLAGFMPKRQTALLQGFIDPPIIPEHVVAWCTVAQGALRATLRMADHQTHRRQQPTIVHFGGLQCRGRGMPVT
jgi:hypothetical protein